MGQEYDDKWPLTLILSDGTLGSGGDYGEVRAHWDHWVGSRYSTLANYCHQKTRPILARPSFFPPRAAGYAGISVIDVSWLLNIDCQSKFKSQCWPRLGTKESPPMDNGFWGLMICQLFPKPSSPGLTIVSQFRCHLKFRAFLSP